MSIKVAVRDLRQILIGFGKVLGKDDSRSALSSIRIVTDGSGTAELTATGGDTRASVRLSGAATGDPAEFLVPVHQLREIAKPAKPPDIVTLSPIGDKVEIATGTRVKRVKVLPVSAYPKSPEFTGKAHALPREAIRAISEAVRCASTDKNRQIINGIHLDTTGKGHHIVGTDGRHLYSANSFRLPLARSAILASNQLLNGKPVKEAKEWHLRLLRDEHGNGGSYEITAGTWRIIGRLVDGNYPAWRQVVPQRDKMTSCVRYAPDRVAGIAATVARLPVASPNLSGNHHPMVVRGDGHVVELLWKEGADERYQSLPIPGATTSGKPFTITLDRKFLAKAFVFGFEEMHVGDALSPARFTDSKGRQMVVMPLRSSVGPLPQRQTCPPPSNHAQKPKPKRTPQTKPTMPDKNHTTEPPITAQAESSIDDSLTELAKVRDALRVAASGLQSAATKLKKAKQDQRAADKEIRSVRSTLDSLRQVRL